MSRATRAVACLFLVPAFTFAQKLQDSWDNLRQLQPGQKIEVVDTGMRTFAGRLVNVSDEVITLQAAKNEQSIERTNVVRVSVRDTSHRMRNMLVGAGIGGGIAVAATFVPLAVSSNEGTSCGACAAAIAAGVGGGAALGAIPGSRTIYRVRKLKSSTAP